MKDIKEYITIEKRDYAVLQNKLYMFEQLNSTESLVQRMKNEEGIIIFKEDFIHNGLVGFITRENLEERLKKFLFYNNIPKWLVYLLNKIWGK